MQETPLHLAAAAGHWECVHALLKGGAPANAADSSGWTPLFKVLATSVCDLKLLVSVVRCWLLAYEALS
jgi:hypothetical protein